MKRWGLLVTALYFATLALLTFPVAYAAMLPHPSVRTALQTYAAIPYWIWIAVLVIGQLLLLLVPIRLAERRPVGRRPLLAPVVVTGFFLGCLTFFFALSIQLALWGDRLFPKSTSGNILLLWTCASIVAGWLLWGVLFFLRSRADAPEALVKRATSWLLRGSVLELLVAVSSHVIVRRRGDCCAPFGTFLGIAAGLSVMLLSFGPGVLFLFQERRRRLQPKEAQAR